MTSTASNEKEWNKEKRKRPGQGRQGWTEPTKIKETRTRVFPGSMLTYRREVREAL
jgi:hypothetical protein